MAPCNHAGSRPLNPDAWMFAVSGSGMYEHHVPGTGTIQLPSIHRVLKDNCISLRSRGRCQAYFMSISTPADLASDLVELLFAQLAAKSDEELIDIAQKLGQVEKTDHDLAPWRVSFSALRDTWGRVCVVLRHQGEKGMITECSCYFYRRRGHCPHSYAILCRLGEMALPVALPARPRADMQSVGSGSSQEGKPLRSRKRKGRPAYVPASVPVLPESKPPIAEPAPKKKPRAMPPQKKARTPFNR